MPLTLYKLVLFFVVTYWLFKHSDHWQKGVFLHTDFISSFWDRTLCQSQRCLCQRENPSRSGRLCRKTLRAAGLEPTTMFTTFKFPEILPPQLPFPSPSVRHSEIMCIASLPSLAAALLATWAISAGRRNAQTPNKVAGNEPTRSRSGMSAAAVDPADFWSLNGDGDGWFCGWNEVREGVGGKCLCNTFGGSSMSE